MSRISKYTTNEILKFCIKCASGDRMSVWERVPCAGYHAFVLAASSLTSSCCARSQHNVRVILHCSCRSFYLLRCSLQILQAMQSPVEPLQSMSYSIVLSSVPWSQSIPLCTSNLHALAKQYIVGSLPLANNSVCAYVSVNVCLCACVRACEYACVCVCVFVYV